MKTVIWEGRYHCLTTAIRGRPCLTPVMWCLQILFTPQHGLLASGRKNFAVDFINRASEMPLARGAEWATNDQGQTISLKDLPLLLCRPWAGRLAYQTWWSNKSKHSHSMYLHFAKPRLSSSWWVVLVSLFIQQWSFVTFDRTVNAGSGTGSCWMVHVVNWTKISILLLLNHGRFSVYQNSCIDCIVNNVMQQSSASLRGKGWGHTFWQCGDKYFSVYWGKCYEVPIPIPGWGKCRDFVLQFPVLNTSPRCGETVGGLDIADKLKNIFILWINYKLIF